MDVKPIKNESDYDAALAKIADLMDARVNTRAGDRLDVLVTPRDLQNPRNRGDDGSKLQHGLAQRLPWRP
ncbi:MAG: hypothetical protein E6J72_07740 [Deltaproteobacteria bacterium]|nr:MAG: hypothetical protein E6J72_07740 [Deltaproteobacteria bacterium]